MKFEPWVGDKYGQPTNLFGGKRVLVVGESHHSKTDKVGSCNPSLTQEVVGHWYANFSERGGWRRTLDNVAWALSGRTARELYQPDRRGEIDVWHSAAFYNYIPEILDERARGARPTRELWDKGKEPFNAVLASLKPQIVVVCGYQLFPWIVRNNFPEFSDDPWSFRGDRLDLQGMRLVRMIHPSTGFSHRRWHCVIKGAVDDE